MRELGRKCERSELPLVLGAASRLREPAGAAATPTPAPKRALRLSPDARDRYSAHKAISKSDAEIVAPAALTCARARPTGRSSSADGRFMDKLLKSGYLA